MVRKTYIRASLFGPDGSRISRTASVTLRGGGQRLKLSSHREGQFFEGEVMPGSYDVFAKTENGLISRRAMTAERDYESKCFYLGRPGWPFYYVNDNPIPFEPRANLLAVCFTEARPRLDQIKDYLREVTKHKLPFWAVDPASLGLCPTNPLERLMWHCASSTDRVQAIGKLTSLTEQVFRASSDIKSAVALGLPVDRGNFSRVLINEYYVELKTPKAYIDVSESVTRCQGTLCRRPEYGRNAWVVSFNGSRYLENLNNINDLRHKNLLSLGEPNLISRLICHHPQGINSSEFESLSGNLVAQGVPEGWRKLREFLKDPALAFGNPMVCVATVDTGVDPSHPRLEGKLSDGNPRVALGYDFRRQIAIPPLGAAKILKSADDGTPQGIDHGMAVIGIIAAKPTKGAKTMGIASNTKQLAFRHKPVSSYQEYADMLLTVAGLNSKAPSPAGLALQATGAVPDVINCSHGFEGTGCPAVVKRALARIATNGRDGLGTIVVYSAGNQDQGPTFLSSDANTIGVSNVCVDAGNEERRESSSNWGFQIDVCALGQGIESIGLDKRLKAIHFGGTSAAASMVTGAIALMLSANPTLTFTQVRGILTETATQIDPDNRHPSGQWITRNGRAFSQWYGCGRLDVGAAVGEAIRLAKSKKPRKRSKKS